MKKQTYDVLDDIAILRSEPDGTTSVEIRYTVSLREKCLRRYFSEYIDFGDRRCITEIWWAERSADPYPATNERAVDIINGRGTAETLQVTVEYIAHFYRIANSVLGSIPQSIGKTEPW